MPTPEVLAHHPFPRSEEVEGGSEPCGRDLLPGHSDERIMRGRPGFVRPGIGQGPVKVSRGLPGAISSDGTGRQPFRGLKGQENRAPG